MRFIHLSPKRNAENAKNFDEAITFIYTFLLVLG